MAKKKREAVRYIDLEQSEGTFKAIFRAFGIAGQQHGGIEFSGISVLRQLLSNEKARILHIMKQKRPTSLYELAKLLGRDFKSVRKDVQLLQGFDLIRLEKAGVGKRSSLKPVLNLDKLQISLSL